MQVRSAVKLDYLLKNEVEEFYELFFGKILIKRSKFSYYSNLVKCLSKDDFIERVLSRLNDTEFEILKLLSFHHTIVPNNFIVEKLSIILSISTVDVRRSFNNLIEKKYVFLREKNEIVIPGVFFNDKNVKTNYRVEKIETPKLLEANTQIKINNIISYFISKETKFSNGLTLYKKDISSIKNIFSKHAKLSEKEFNLIGYFYSIAFLDEESNLIMRKVEDYFRLSFSERVYFFIKTLFPGVYSIFEFVKKEKKTLNIDLDEFEKLWERSLLISDINTEPFKLNYKETLEFVNSLGILEIKDDRVILYYFDDEAETKEDNMKINSSFNIYVNSDSKSDRYFFTVLFADMKKYDKFVEYEINENSIKRSILYGIDIEKIVDHLKNNNLELPKNVAATVKQWFDKQASFFFTQGTLFFANSKEKGKLISTIAEKGLIRVYEIKKDEVFLVPEEEKENFFKFLKKSGISYFAKQPKAANAESKKNIVDIAEYLQKEM